jgi:hypothetical protein
MAEESNVGGETKYLKAQELVIAEMNRIIDAKQRSCVRSDEK